GWRPDGGSTARSVFFQAEDGIRDRNVTGVQTCALPIYLAPTGPRLAPSSIVREVPDTTTGVSSRKRPSEARWLAQPLNGSAWMRSEERRVGEEPGGGSRGARARAGRPGTEHGDAQDVTG